MFIKTKIAVGLRGSIEQYENVKDLLKAIDAQFVTSDKALTSTLIMKFSSLKHTSMRGVHEHIMQMRDIAAQLKNLEVDMSESFMENDGSTLRRSTRLRRSAIPDDNIVYLQESDIGTANDLMYFLEAMSCKESELWYNAMKEEMNSMKNSFRRYPNLREIGGKIVEKCGGFPLAVKALGGLLWNERNENEWVNVLESCTWTITEDNNGVLPALKICYQKLPANSKMCFRYCSLFPRDYYFKDNELVELWIGEEYIQDEECRQIDKATQIFYDLLIKSFLSVDSFWSDRPRFKMHDLAHNLAEAVSNEEFVRLEEGKPSVIPQGARHSSFVCFNEKPLVKLEELCKYKRDVRGIFPTEQLDLLLQCKLMRLPYSICNLETLDLRDCILMNELPKDIKNVINLRFLYLKESMDSIPLFPHVGNLRKQQILPSLGVRREAGYMISELKEMSDLKGGIIIFNLQNVVYGEEAMQAKTKNKPYITRLDFGMVSYEW
ncbi:putative disease resistance protein RGA3 [Aristolochia californica]|uniref:putative disease resistance protein RGA3 n=1 Tax=Aristolochia californica TaxID=171875 RepID=UPI0035E04599